jgi:hypothetical protein
MRTPPTDIANRASALNNDNVKNRGTLAIDVDPLAVSRSLGKLVDSFLRHLEPITDADFVAGILRERSDTFNLRYGHFSVLYTLKNRCGSLATADTHRNHAIARFATPHLAKYLYRQFRT